MYGSDMRLCCLTEGTFNFYAEAHRFKLSFGFPGPVDIIFQFSLSRSVSPSRDLVLSRIYPSRQDCFLAHLQGITVHVGTGLLAEFALCSVSSRLMELISKSLALETMFHLSSPAGGCPFFVLSADENNLFCSYFIQQFKVLVVEGEGSILV